MRRFFADASHELRTPLASLRANAQLYQQGALQDPSEVDEVMDRIVLETRRTGRLVDDMLVSPGSASIPPSPGSRSTSPPCSPGARSVPGSPTLRTGRRGSPTA